MTYSSETVPTSTLKDLLTNNWNDQEGNIPLPDFREATSTETRVDLAIEGEDVIVIRMEDAGIEEKWRSNYSYADVTVPIRLEIYTQKSRQRLYDLFQECRRIIRVQKHNVGDYQLTRWHNFNEFTMEQMNVWMGASRITLESLGISI